MKLKIDTSYEAEARKIISSVVHEAIVANHEGRAVMPIIKKRSKELANLMYQHDAIVADMDVAADPLNQDERPF